MISELEKISANVVHVSSVSAERALGPHPCQSTGSEVEVTCVVLRSREPHPSISFGYRLPFSIELYLLWMQAQFLLEFACVRLSFVPGARMAVRPAS